MKTKEKKAGETRAAQESGKGSELKVGANSFRVNYDIVVKLLRQKEAELDDCRKTFDEATARLKRQNNALREALNQVRIYAADGYAKNGTREIEHCLLVAIAALRNNQ